MASSLSIELYLSGAQALLIGSGPIAHDRKQRLERAGADVVTMTEKQWNINTLSETLRKTKLLLCCEEPTNRELSAQTWVFAREIGALHYAHDRPDQSDFALPAQIQSGLLRVAISTGGAAPALARRVRELLEPLFDGPVRGLLEELSAARQRLPSGDLRMRRLREAAERLTFSGAFSIHPPAPEDSDEDAVLNRPQSANGER